MPSSEANDDDRARRLQSIDIELSRYWNSDWRAGQEFFQTQRLQPGEQIFNLRFLKDPVELEKVRALLAEKQTLTDQMSQRLQQRSWSGINPWLETNFNQRLFDKEETFSLKRIEDFSLNLTPRNPFPLEHRLYTAYRLRLDNDVVLGEPSSGNDEDTRATRFFRARLECDAEFKHPSVFSLFGSGRSSKVYEFNWYNHKFNGQKIHIEFSEQVRNCHFRFYDPMVSSTWTHGFELTDLATVSPAWMKLTSKIDVCVRPDGNFGSGVSNFFWKQDFNFNTCPQTFDRLYNLRDPYISMNRKVISLTGSPLNRKDFDDKNPMASLDFSKAPRFDIIWISSLNFSADFYGMILARALRYHAERGAQVRILVPEVTMTAKDKRIIEWIQVGMPNIKAQYYKYQLTGRGDGGFIDKFHRVNHTKLIIGHSTVNPRDNFLITGGRNIRDSYIFNETPFYRAYLYLKNYGDGEESYIYYDDFEVEIRGAQFVNSVLAQMVSFWMRDSETQRFRSTNINIPKAVSPAEVSRLTDLPRRTPLVRHIMSLPFFDGYQLERYYIDMFDSAQSELLLTTPYFRPSVALSAALDRAVQRGVRVKVITRIQLAGDGTPRIAEDVNKQGVNRHMANVEIYEWADDKSILHAKILVIDRKLSFVSSVNMNRRSFIHDTESGALILHEPTANDLRQEVMSYLQGSRRLTAKEKVSWINSTLIDWADSYF